MRALTYENLRPTFASGLIAQERKAGLLAVMISLQVECSLAVRTDVGAMIPATRTDYTSSKEREFKCLKANGEITEAGEWF